MFNLRRRVSSCLTVAQPAPSWPCSWVHPHALLSRLLPRCAGIGDEFLRVRSQLSQPAILLGLKRHLGSWEAAEFFMAEYVHRLDFGFKLLNVTLTTQKVLSLLVSMVVTLIFIVSSVYGTTRSDP